MIMCETKTMVSQEHKYYQINYLSQYKMGVMKGCIQFGV